MAVDYELLAKQAGAEPDEEVYLVAMTVPEFFELMDCMPRRDFKTALACMRKANEAYLRRTAPAEALPVPSTGEESSDA